MIPPPDPFTQSFDQIEVDAAPLRQAIESAMSLAAPQETADPVAPGFYLLNDAGGRFVADRDTGVISLADEELLARERGAIHAVQLRVIEPSGASYDLAMELCISGRVPQMVGADEFTALAALTDDTVLTAVRVPTLITPAEEPAPTAEAREPAATPAQIAWTHFAVAQGHFARTSRAQPRRSFIAPELPAASQSVTLSFDGLPAPFAAHLPWSL